MDDPWSGYHSSQLGQGTSSTQPAGWEEKNTGATAGRDIIRELKENFENRFVKVEKQVESHSTQIAGLTSKMDNGFQALRSQADDNMARLTDLIKELRVRKAETATEEPASKVSRPEGKGDAAAKQGGKGDAGKQSGR